MSRSNRSPHGSPYLRTAAAACRLLGLLLVVVWAIAPARVRAATPPAPPALADAAPDFDEFDGGACGEDEQPEAEYVHCGAELSAFEAPALIGILRDSLERMRADKCLELLDDLYDRELCSVGGRECGSVTPRAIPPGPELSLGSGPIGRLIGRSDFHGANERALAGPTDDPALPSRAIDPPDRPPRSHTHS